MMMGTDRCMKMQEKARTLIPGMTQLLSKRPDQFSLGVWPGYYDRAKGAEVWDLDGNRYLDMSISGIGANVLGYADEDVDSAVKRAVDSGVSCSLNCPEEVELAELLCEIHRWADMARFTRTGGESMAMAVRIARAHTGRDKVAFCGYHGWHDWYLAANLSEGDALGEHLLEGLDPNGVPRGLAGTALPFHYNRLGELEAIVARHGKELAAIVMEPIRSDDPEPGFLDGVRGLADECGAVLIVDEISAGFRLNSGGAHLVLGLAPDMAVFSKAMGNGYAIGAVLGKAAVMTAAQSTFISSTCWTERVGPAAALATIRKHRALDAGSRLQELGARVQECWRTAAEAAGLPVSVGGMLPLGHFGFSEGDGFMLKALFVQLMLERGFLASNLFYAMYAHTDENVDAYAAAVSDAFGELSDALRSDDVEDRLAGRPSAKGFARLT